MTRMVLWLALAPILLVWLPTTYAQEGSPAATPLFDSHETLNVRMVAPFDDIARDRPIDEYVSGKIYYSAGDEELVELDIGIRARGRYRRRPDICAFPPLRLNFKKSQVEDSLFAGNDKIKLVTHCRTGSHVYEQAILAEYLAYRILNQLTDISFRVRLLQIEYVTADVEESFDGYGVLIEHKDNVAKRIGVSPLSIESTPVSSMNPEHLNLSSVFQYLIGNTDFSPIAGSPGDDCCHNHTLFGNEGESYFSIPYDFDMSGFVSAPYAAPNPKLHLDSVQERRYRGRCVNNDLLPTTLEAFLAKRSDIESLVREQSELSRRKRNDLLTYIDQFYRSVSNSRGVNRNLIRKCE